MIRLLVITLLLQQVFTDTAVSQQVFRCALKIPLSLNRDKLRIYYANGRKSIRINPAKDSEVTILSDSFFNEHADISFYYPDESDKYNSFRKMIWISNKPSQITFYLKKAGNVTVADCRLENAIDTDLAGGNLLKAFLKKEEEDITHFVVDNNDSLPNNDSLKNELSIKADKMNRLRFKFAVENSHLFYALWLFRTQIIMNPGLNPDTLQKIYVERFSVKFRNSLDGKEVTRILTNRSSLRNGQTLVDFKTKDIDGNSISASDFKGKYILLDFWASWCGPCIEQMPTIEALLSSNKNKNIQVISISLDRDPVAFKKAIQIYNIIGRKIFNNQDLIQSFAVVAIPQIILINPDGKVIYNFQENSDANLGILSRLLAEM